MSRFNRSNRSFARAQYAWDNMSPPEYDDDDSLGCLGAHIDCAGCAGCIKEVRRTKLVIARKARGSILPGDLVRVSNGFCYQSGGGPRTGYSNRESIVGFGPGHGPEKMGQGRWPDKGRSFASVHPAHVVTVEAREAREAGEAKAKAEAQAVARLALW